MTHSLVCDAHSNTHRYRGRRWRAYVGGLVTLTLVAPHDLACLPSGAGSLSLVHLLRGRSRICGVVTDAHRLDAACNGRLSSGSVVIEQCACFGGGRRSSMWPLRGSPVYCTGYTSFSQRVYVLRTFLCRAYVLGTRFHDIIGTYEFSSLPGLRACL